MTWILGDLRKDSNGVLYAPVGGGTLGDWTLENLGSIVMLGPLEAHTMLDLTAAPGVVSGVYYSLCFQLRKWDMWVQKADEAIDVSPMHAQYYQLTMRQKEELENKIKAGLASAAQAVSDYELLKHDERKYQEFKDYYDRKDEHSLRAVFIDQVDVHTGDGISMRSIVSRWPTLISDFMRLTPEDTDAEKVKSRLGISKAEAVILTTKNKLYNEWKELFIREVEGRLARIRELIASREESVRQYREWLKPYIARFKMLEQAFESPGIRKVETTSFFRAGGHAVSSSRVRLWAWKDFQPTELKRMSPELMGEQPIDPYDDFIKRELIWHPQWGLVTDYPWITPKWVDNAVKEIKREWMTLHRLYYGFLEITFVKSNLRLADGAEIEDGVFDINALMMSQNALLAKLLEAKARQEELERYIDRLLGIKSVPEAPMATTAPERAKEEAYKLAELEAQLKKEKGVLSELEKKIKSEKSDTGRAKLELDIFKQKKKIETLRAAIDEKSKLVKMLTPSKKMRIGLPWGMIAFRPAGPYERMLEERLTKYFAKAVAENMYGPTVNFLKEKFGYGRP